MPLNLERLYEKAYYVIDLEIVPNGIMNRKARFVSTRNLKTLPCIRMILS